jgi:hypothetical protein
VSYIISVVVNCEIVADLRFSLYYNYGVCVAILNINTLILKNCLLFVCLRIFINIVYI